ncbi:hypothetical protein [Lactobacillus crispatus]|uniref:hypothetical protein n=1 Tax=Lactobacillus crispatus TaxID=47770 RepID=UPI001788CD91|nr:hypothetical protein [Lactobacillus crispatus]
MASNKFKVSSTKVNGIKINNNYYAGKSAKIYNQLAKQTAVDSIKLFTKKYGPYPYFEPVKTLLRSSKNMIIPKLSMI